MASHTTLTSQVSNTWAPFDKLATVHDVQPLHGMEHGILSNKQIDQIVSVYDFIHNTILSKIEHNQGQLSNVSALNCRGSRFIIITG